MSNFFQELQRRHVFKASITYLVVSWLILQVASIVFPIVGVGPGVMRMVLITITIGFPIWVVFSYIYEWTPEGFKKTEKFAPEVKDAEADVDSGKPKKKLFKTTAIYVIVSLIAIPAIAFIFPLLDLATFHQRWTQLLIVLGLPITLLFAWARQNSISAELRKRNKLIASIAGTLISIGGFLLGYNVLGASLTHTVSIEDEAGNITEHAVLNARFIPRLHIFSLNNDSDLKNLEWIGNGLRVAINDDLSQFTYVSMYNETDFHEREQKQYSFGEKVQIANASGSQYFVDGSFDYSEGALEVSMRMFEIDDQIEIENQTYRFQNVIDAGDSLSLIIRKWLKIDPVIMKRELDIPLREFLTESDSAFKYYSYGGDALQRAVRLDSSFSIASAEYALRGYVYNRGTEKNYINVAMAERDILPEIFKKKVLALNYAIHENPKNALNVLTSQIKLQPNSLFLLGLKRFLQRVWLEDEYLETLDVISRIRQLSDEEVIECMRFLIRKSMYVEAIQRALRYRNENLESRGFYIEIGKAYMTSKNYKLARVYFEKHQLEIPEDKYISKMIESVDYYENNDADHIEKKLEAFEGQFWFSGSNLIVNKDRIDHFVFSQGSNQPGYPEFLLNDTTIVAYRIDSNNGIFFKQSANKNKNGETYGLTHQQIELTNYTTERTFGAYPIWLVDSVFDAAKMKLLSMNYPESKELFLDVLSRYSEFYFVQDYLDHIDFMTNEKFITERLNLHQIAGQYSNGGLEIWVVDNQFKYQKEGDKEYSLLPLSSNSLKKMGDNELFIEVVRDEKERVEGLQSWVLNFETMEYEKVEGRFQQKDAN